MAPAPANPRHDSLAVPEFAVPVDTLERTIQQLLKETPTYTRSMSLTSVSEELARRLGCGPGALQRHCSVLNSRLTEGVVESAEARVECPELRAWALMSQCCFPSVEGSVGSAGPLISTGQNVESTPSPKCARHPCDRTCISGRCSASSDEIRCSSDSMG